MNGALTDHRQHSGKDTAAVRMTADVPLAFSEQSLGEIRAMLTGDTTRFTTISQIYIVDHKKKLVGVLPVRDLLGADMHIKAGDICKKLPLVSVHPGTHQERVAYLALQHNIKNIPVIDHQGVFLGAITSDVILSILHKEMHEDSLRRAGIRHPDALYGDVLTLPLFTSFRHRIPWLLLGLLGGVLTARIIGFFEATLAENLVLAAFIPLIVYMSDAVGTQMEAYIIRDLATRQSLPILRYFLRHFLVVMSIGFFLSALLLLAYGLMTSDWHLGLVLSLSLFASVCSSVCTGLLIPFGFSKFSLDPADASGPVATVLQDMMSIVIYFGIATLLL